VALIALIAGATAWKRWRVEAAATGADDYEAQLGEARRLREAGRLPEAIAGYRRALATRDTSAAEAELGRTLSEAARPAAAIDAFRRAVELDAANAAAYIALGEACLGEQRLVDARWAFERYLALEPQGDRADAARAALRRIDNCK
jgi:Flp pilus assembly protein TadD